VIGFLKNLKEITSLPLALGFGLSNREQINQIKGYCDGVIIGSKILSMLLEARSFNGGLKEVKNFALDINKVLKNGIL
ncbi:MAG: tryptophan synthase subunit alpha, partial [Candidatus Hydromicrobium sp.]|nr:tryptophan synthase subunit alpha [Candidatus Hydromicrobium sp.]